MTPRVKEDLWRLFMYLIIIFWVLVLLGKVSLAAEPLVIPTYPEGWSQTDEGRALLEEMDHVHFCNLPEIDSPVECETRWYLVFIVYPQGDVPAKYIMPPSLPSERRCLRLGDFVMKQVLETPVGIECIPTATQEQDHGTN